MSVGIRANTDELADVLRTQFSAFLAPDTGAYPHYSLRIEPAPLDPTMPRPLHRLFEGCRTIVRHRCAAKPLETLRAALGGHLRDGEAEPLVLVRAQVLTHGSDAVLLPHLTPSLAGGVERRWTEQGVRRLETRLARIDPAAATLVVPDLLPWDEPVDAASRLGSHQVSANTMPTGGTYRIRGWILDGEPEQPTRARALVDAIGLVLNRQELGIRQTLELLGRVLSGSRVGRTHDSDPSTVIALAADMLGRDGQRPRGRRRGPTC